MARNRVWRKNFSNRCALCEHGHAAHSRGTCRTYIWQSDSYRMWCLGGLPFWKRQAIEYGPCSCVKFVPYSHVGIRPVLYRLLGNQRERSQALNRRYGPEYPEVKPRHRNNNRRQQNVRTRIF